MADLLLFAVFLIAAIAAFVWVRGWARARQACKRVPLCADELPSSESSPKASAEKPAEQTPRIPEAESPSLDTCQELPAPSEHGQAVAAGLSADPSLPLPREFLTPSNVSAAETVSQCHSLEKKPAVLPAGNDGKELKEAAVKQEQTAATEPKTTILSSEPVCQPSQAERPPDETSQETTQTALQSNVAADTLPAPAAPPGIPANEIATMPAPDLPPGTIQKTKPPEYHPLVPVSPTTPPRPEPPTTNRQPGSTPPLELWLQLAFGRDGGVKSLALVPERREGMPSQIEIGESRLSECSDDHYEPNEPIVLENIGDVLRQGVAWQGRGDARRWRWTLTGRELYVLASGDVSGLYPFGSSPRLLLNADHAVLTTVGLREEAETALGAAGCANFNVLDEATPGVPPGWLLFRDVKPTRTTPMRDDAHILNALCPLPDIEPHYTGGIRLKRQTWLAGFPPRIHFTGALSDDFRVMIDGQPAQPVADGAFEAPGWDAAVEHLLWFGGKTDRYAIHTMDEDWEWWHAYDFGTGAAICGPSVHGFDGARCWQVRVPVGNRVLVGARPGEVFVCPPMRADIRWEVLIVLPPFNPVWAVPSDPAHANRTAVRIIMLHSAQPRASAETRRWNPAGQRALRSWCAVINDAGRKRLALATENEDVRNLWRRYCAVAKQLWRRMR